VIYLTGATGFIGSRVARRLIERGERIRCLVRNRSRGHTLEELGAELVDGDVADRGVHERAMHGADAAIHLAAIYDIGIVDSNVLQHANVDGTKAFLEAAEAARVRRIIYISSNVALGPVAGEPTEAYEGPYHSVYHRTKAAAHRLARDAQRRGLPVIIVCPSFVYGPGDEGPAGRFICDLVRRKVPALLSTPSWFSYVHVDDVAAGIVGALDHGRIGEVYLLTGDETNMNDFAARVAGLARVKPPALRFPVFLAKPTGRFLDAVARLTGLRFPITREAVQTTSVDRWLHTHTRATRDLGYNPRDLTAGLPDTVQWALARRS
jgi:dihydroflavonol-4-reductase